MSDPVDTDTTTAEEAVPNDGSDATIPEGTAIGSTLIEDYISGTLVRATPEERDAVQVFARRLVQDFGYPKSHIQTRPQFRVRKRPSEQRKSYPVDIAVFSSPEKTDEQLRLIVECKRKDQREGEEQLRLYMDMSPAEIGVWFNGSDHAYLRKVHHPDGSRTYETLPNIPRYGQRIEDIGQFARKDLSKPSNLKAVFKDLRNHLAGHAVGVTRDETLAREIINLLFCKIYDEINTGADDIVRFRVGAEEDAAAVSNRIRDLFVDVKREYADVFDDADSIQLDDLSVSYLVGELQNYAVTEADRDAIGDAFEVFIGPALRGQEGQFFTPRNVVRMAISILDPKAGETILDPACGSGGFLIVGLEHVWRQLEHEAKDKGWGPVTLERKKRDVATRYFRGLDKDSFLAKVTKAYMAIVGDGRGGIFCENSLLSPTQWSNQAHEKVSLGDFDIVVTNPPFGKKIKITGRPLLAQYALGHEWKHDKDADEMRQTTSVRDDQTPQLLFLERCLQFLRPGGRLGIVLPEAIFGMPKYRYISRDTTTRKSPSFLMPFAAPVVTWCDSES
jgi:type I restriction enzyme M protein